MAQSIVQKEIFHFHEHEGHNIGKPNIKSLFKFTEKRTYSDKSGSNVGKEMPSFQ